MTLPAATPVTSARTPSQRGKFHSMLAVVEHRGLVIEELVRHETTPIARWTELTALAPSPTAAATRFIDPWRTSPAANTEGTLVSNGSGDRPSAVQVPSRSSG